jgi:hypothetical protein
LIRNHDPTNAFVRPAKHVFLPLDEIDISQAIRPYNATVVAELARSIREIGLQTPLTCIVRDGRHILVSGRNRLEALRNIGAEQAPVRIVDFTDIEAQLWRLGENLFRAELTKLEYDRQVVQYAELLKVKQAARPSVWRVARSRQARAPWPLRGPPRPQAGTHAVDVVSAQRLAAGRSGRLIRFAKSRLSRWL